MMPTTAMMAQTRDLDLVIRHVLAGLGHGIHAGRERGAGVEFSEYRAYAPGDEWRRVDWKLLARADRYFIREAERDNHVAVWLWLDATASMAEPSREINGIDKLWFARTVLACVAAIAQRQGDAFGLVVCSGDKVDFTLRPVAASVAARTGTAKQGAAAGWPACQRGTAPICTLPAALRRCSSPAIFWTGLRHSARRCSGCAACSTTYGC
jgi:uncharacterized protein (DUF58 family)